MFNPYEMMKPKMKKNYEEALHYFNLYNAVQSMFEYKGLPDTLRPEFIELMLLTQGTCGVAKIKGELYTGPGGYCGEVKNFIPTEYQFVNVGVGEFRGKVGENIAVGWNNGTATPDLSLMQFSSILTEIDVSERCNVLFTRFMRIPKVSDNKEKKAIEDSIKAILEGRFEAVVSDNVMELLADIDPDNQFLDLVDVKEVDKLQYLNQYRDNVIKRFFQIHGQGMQSTAKLAQQTTDELHGNDSVSMILPLQCLKYRQKMCDDINNLFATDISVDFTEAFRDSYEEMEEMHDDGTIDNTPTKGDDVNVKEGTDNDNPEGDSD